MSLLYKRLERLANDDSRILDSGIGDGEGLRGIDGEIVGIDLHHDCANDEVTYCRADGTHLPFASDTFDFVVSNQVLEHIPHEQKAAYVEEIARVLKPSGECLISFPSRLYPPPPHLMPPFFTWLPKPVGLWVAKHLLSGEQFEFYRDKAFNLSPLLARRILSTAFEDIQYQTVRLAENATSVENPRWQRFQQVLPAVRLVRQIPSVGFVFELFFGYVCYSCRQPTE